MEFLMFRSAVLIVIFWFLDASSEEKNRLEEKQRESRRNRKDEYKGTWFYLSRHPVTNDEVWLFNNKYWLRDFSKSPDLF
jgi:hypothetical protein